MVYGWKEIDTGTFAISEYKHWEEAPCYLLLGSERAFLIDTGLDVSNIKSVVDNLTSLSMFVITIHTHWDHIGGDKHLTDFAVHENDVSWITERFPIPLHVDKKNLTLNPCVFLATSCLDDYSIFSGTRIRILYDGDQIDLGNRTLKMIHTPGHLP